MAYTPESLSSWKEIAAYLKRTPRTCQRLERTMGLPIHRLDGSSKARVFAYPAELDAWLSKMIHERERKRRRFLLGLLAGAVVVVAVAALLLGILRSRKPAPAASLAPVAKSIAVLPFTDLSPDQGRGDLCEGISDAVINALGRIRGFRVTGRTSAAAVKYWKLDVREIGRRLDVMSVLDGSIQVEGDRLRINAQIISAEDGFVLWTKEIDGRLGDIFSIQDEISMSIVENLKVTLLATEESALRKRPTADVDAYNLYLKGRYLLGRPRPEAPGEALGLFREALERDPKFALAQAGIAWVYMNMISQFVARPNEAGPKAAAAAKAALELDPELADAHALNGWVQFLYGHDWDAAVKSFQRALELKPGDAMTRGMYAFSLFIRKRFEEARTEIKLALASDPLVPVLSAYSMWIHLYSGHSDEVLREFQRVQQLEPNFEFAHFGAGMAYLNQGRIDESIEMFKKACGLPHNNGRPEAGLAVAYLKKGDRKAAEALYGKLLEEWEKKRIGSPVNVAWVAASLGEMDRAFDLLDKAVLERDPSLPMVQVYAEAQLPELTRAPRFLAILDRLRLPH